MRRLVVAAVILLFGVSFTAAEEFAAVIKKIDGNKVTFIKISKGKDKKPGEEMTLPAADNVKVVKATFGKDKKFEAGDPIEGGLKSDIFTKGEKGTFGFIITDADGKNITEIRVPQFDFKKKPKKDDK